MPTQNFYEARQSTAWRTLIASAAVLLLTWAAAAQAPRQRIPRQESGQSALALWVHTADNVGIPGAQVTVENAASGERKRYRSDANGIVRIANPREGQYIVSCEMPGWQPYRSVALTIARGEVKTLAITLVATAGETAKPWRGVGAPPMPPVEVAGDYQELPRAGAAPATAAPAPPLPADKDLYVRTPDRWEIEMPDWKRYNRNKEELQRLYLRDGTLYTVTDLPQRTR